METQSLELPKTVLALPGANKRIPPWMEALEPELAKPEDLEKLDRLPELTVVWFHAIHALLRRKSFLSHLSSNLSRSDRQSRVVFILESKAESKRGAALAQSLFVLFSYFDRPSGLEIAVGSEAAQDAVWEAVAKIAASRPSAEPAVGSRDPLATVKEVLAATKGLRASSGKLSADKVAEAFGIPVAELAELFGKSRQAVSKTPDADSLQPLLRPFERVARLRAELDAEEFRSWLHLANWQLERRTPIDLIREGKVGIVADLAEDLLTGQPG